MKEITKQDLATALGNVLDILSALLDSDDDGNKGFQHDDGLFYPAPNELMDAQQTFQTFESQSETTIKPIETAKRLAREIADMGYTRDGSKMAHGHSLELIARVAGLEQWNVLSAILKSSTLTAATGEKPTVVVCINGGLVENIYSDAPVNVIKLDYDIEGADEDQLITINGEEAYAFRQFAEEDVEYVRDIAMQIDAEDTKGDDDADINAMAIALCKSKAIQFIETDGKFVWWDKDGSQLSAHSPFNTKDEAAVNAMECTTFTRNDWVREIMDKDIKLNYDKWVERQVESAYYDLLRVPQSLR